MSPQVNSVIRTAAAVTEPSPILLAAARSTRRLWPGFASAWFAIRGTGLPTVRLVCPVEKLRMEISRTVTPPDQKGRHRRPSFMSRAKHGSSAASSPAVPLTLAGAVALILAGAGAFSAPTAAVGPLAAMGTWPPVALPGLSSATDHDPDETTSEARITADRASRSGDRAELTARPDDRTDLAKPAERTRRHAPARTRAELVELKWERQRRPSAAGYWLPTHDYELTARFGAGGGLWSGSHAGLDFAAPTGTPVRAVAGGRVREAGWDGAYGWRIVVRHRDGTETWYCHLTQMLITGDRVAAGQRIGRVGSTGNSTGPHLHFEVHPAGGRAVDPLPWLASRGLDAVRLAFRADRDRG